MIALYKVVNIEIFRLGGLKTNYHYKLERFFLVIFENQTAPNTIFILNKMCIEPWDVLQISTISFFLFF